VHKLLSEHREQAYLSRQLAKIHCEAPLECSAKSLEWNMPEPEGLKRLFTGLDFGSQLSNRFQRLYEKA
jgi:5'-3' exonuclease